MSGLVGNSEDRFSCIAAHLQCAESCAVVLTRIFKLPIEPVREKTHNLGSDQVRYKLGCTVIEDG